MQQLETIVTSRVASDHGKLRMLKTEKKNDAKNKKK